MKPAPHELRVHAERQELEDKWAKLDTFILSPAIFNLEEPDKQLLRMQHNVMKTYLDILDMRIARFPKE